MIEIQTKQSQTPEVCKSALEICCGDFDKSGPGPKAKSAAYNAMNNRNPKVAKAKPGGSVFAESQVQNPSNRSRPAAADRLAQQFQTGQAKGENRFSARSTQNRYNPWCAGRSRSIVVLSGQGNKNLSTSITAYDGFKVKLTDKSKNHLMRKHGHIFDVNDPLMPNPNQKPTK